MYRIGNIKYNWSINNLQSIKLWRHETFLLIFEIIFLSMQMFWLGFRKWMAYSWTVRRSCSQIIFAFQFGLFADHVYGNFNNLLHDFDWPWQTPVLLQEYGEKIHEKGTPLDNCFDSIYGTVKLICRPGINQKIHYNGHKCVHSIKF